MNQLIYYPYNNQYRILLEYIYDKYSDKINKIVYLSENTSRKYYYGFKQDNNTDIEKSIVPYECNINFKKERDGREIEFNYNLQVMNHEDDVIRTIYQNMGNHDGGEDRILKESILSTEKKEDLIWLMDEVREYIINKHEIKRRSTVDTIRIFYYQKDYWNLLAKSPKRPLHTLYLKEGEKDKLISIVKDFFDVKTRDIYLSYGMPYKNVILLYGVPGTGKTSTISTIASYFSCDIYTIPITKELSDYGLIDAFSYINEKEDKKRIIVLEDIDCIFDASRKEGDEKTLLSLQSILNCLDGHMCMEGTLLFLTANNPDKLDYAMIRSCRIDHKLELGYADEYQTKNIFNTFIPDQIDNFNKFYKKIKHKQFTTAMLQEFLFYNRKCDNIIDEIPQLINIIDKNKPEELSNENKDKNLYL